MKLIILSICTFSFLTVCIGCEMTKGVGKDVENTGKNIQETVDRNK